MFAMSLKFLLPKSGAFMLYGRDLVSRNVQKLSSFRALIKRCVQEEGVVCGTN